MFFWNLHARTLSGQHISTNAWGCNEYFCRTVKKFFFSHSVLFSSSANSEINYSKVSKFKSIYLVKRFQVLISTKLIDRSTIGRAGNLGINYAKVVNVSWSLRAQCVSAILTCANRWVCSNRGILLWQSCENWIKSTLLLVKINIKNNFLVTARNCSFSIVIILVKKSWLVMTPQVFLLIKSLLWKHSNHDMGKAVGVFLVFCLETLIFYRDKVQRVLWTFLEQFFQFFNEGIYCSGVMDPFSDSL